MDNNSELLYHLQSLEGMGISVRTDKPKHTKKDLREVINIMRGGGLMEGTIKSLAKQALSCLED